MSVSDLPPRWTLGPFHSIRGLLERAGSARQMDGHVILLFLHFLCFLLLLLFLLVPFLLLLLLPFHLSSTSLLPPSSLFPSLHLFLPFLPPPLLIGLGQVQYPTQGRGLGRQEGANISSDICQRPVVTTHSWRSGEVAGSQWRRLQARVGTWRKVRSRQGRTDGRRRGQRDERETAVRPPERTTSQLAFTPR